MTKKSNIFNKLSRYLKHITVGRSEFTYATVYGLFSITVLLAKQIFTLLFQKNGQLIGPEKFYFILPIGLLMFCILLVIRRKKLEEDNKFAKVFIQIFPFLFVILGITIVSMYSSHIDRIVSYMVIMAALFWMQIYKLWRRILVFAFAAVCYIIFSLVIYGPGEILNIDISFALMASWIFFLAASIIFQLHNGHKIVNRDLDLKNKKFILAIDNLKITHTSLKISKKITDTMYELTQEVLKNEEIDNVLQMVLEKAATLIPNSQAGSILIKRGDFLEFVAAQGYNLKKIRKIVLKPEETFQAFLVDKYEPFVVKDLITFDEAHLEPKNSGLLKTSTAIAKSCMTCSFKYQDEFYGSINVDNFDSEEIFTENDKYLIKQLAQEIEIIISVHKLYEKALRPTKYDDLTKAKTRRYCITLLEDIINKDKDMSIAICTIDINNLKTINDKYGHDIGDKYLFEFAEAVRNSNLSENIFGRVGGDEFLLIFKDSNKEKAMKQIQVIKKYLKNNLLKVENKKIEISFASGVSVYSVDGMEIMDLIKLSDKRMYEDKNQMKKIEKA